MLQRCWCLREGGVSGGPDVAKVVVFKRVISSWDIEDAWRSPGMLVTLSSEVSSGYTPNSPNLG